MIKIDSIGKMIFKYKNKEFFLNPSYIQYIRFGRSALNGAISPPLDESMDPNLLCILPMSVTGKGHDKWLYFYDPNQME